jgi:membrane associated rhomboid family serine protease
MRWIDKLDGRFGYLGIPGLIRIVVAFTALVYLLTYINPDFVSVLDLDPARIMRGEIWRLVTYIFLPRVSSPLWVLLALWFLWFIGEGLERAWGPFRLTLYFLLGMIGTTVAALKFQAHFANAMLMASLFYAFAWFYPDEVIYVFFILPVKIKWLAWISAAFLLAGFVLQSNSYRIALAAAFINYLLFFGPEIVHRMKHRHDVSTRRRRFEGDMQAKAEPLHKCATCGATEFTDPNMEFRVARDGEEYCMSHLPRAENVAR